MTEDIRPSYYKHGGIEAIDVIEAWGLNFNLGSVLKYLARQNLKGEPLRDLTKARFYLNREIEQLEHFEQLKHEQEQREQRCKRGASS
jgi:Protein of unknwon function (DUF3310)